VRYRFITPKNFDRTYNRNAFNQRFNHLLQLARNRELEEGEYKSQVMKQLTKKFESVAENRKAIENVKKTEISKQK
jgi:hypothetical protein